MNSLLILLLEETKSALVQNHSSEQMNEPILMFQKAMSMELSHSQVQVQT